MADIWFISDTHLGHNNILTFLHDGVRLRQFDNIHHMEECIFDNWITVVRPQDKVYHLGDVSFTQDAFLRMKLLPGHKRLVRGNHDKFKTKFYLEVFEEVYGVRQIDRYWLSHVPMHPVNIEAHKINIHGHMHKNTIASPKYFNASVECINYTPVNFEVIKEIWDKNFSRET